MNHDYVHCIDCDEDCPKDCFRVQLEEDLMRKAEKAWKITGDPLAFNIPISYARLRGTSECELNK